MNKINITIKKALIWWISIIFLECFFALLITHNIKSQLIINIILNSTILSLIITFITSLFNEIINNILSGVILFIIGILFSTQVVFYKVFKVYFSLYDIALKDQLNSFMKETINFIISNILYIFLFMLPLILFIVFRKKLSNNRINLKTSIILLICIVSSILINKAFISFNKNKTYSTYDLINNVSNTALSIQKLGVLKTYYIEGKRMIFGFTPKEIKPVKTKAEELVEVEKEYADNILNLKLEDTDNQTINTINAYIRNEEVTKKNEYTGIFEGYNLVYITAESFSEIGVREDLTPTLYKMMNSGFVFKNFYTPNNLSTIGGEFQSLTGLYPDYSVLKTWRNGTNYFPYALATEYRSRGYDTYAYHNNSYVFQDRNQYLASQGFTNFLACYNGLEQRMNCEIWPESDEEMIEVTKGDYIHNSNPFLAYYMTVSGHFAYTFDDNYIAYKNMPLVENLGYSEEAKAYLATQIELDRALENLINSLEAENKLDKTVFVLQADHYPYELERYAINELSSYERDDISVNHNALIIWNNKLETTIIDKPCMSADVIPTVYNLFGIDYDSRLFTGKDILSTSAGIAVLEDRSWITNKGIYIASINEFYPKDNAKIEEDYVNNINQIVNNRLNLSRLIIENNYYNYLNYVE